MKHLLRFVKNILFYKKVNTVYFSKNQNFDIEASIYDLIAGDIRLNRVLVFEYDIDYEYLKICFSKLVELYPLICGQIARTGLTKTTIRCDNQGFKVTWQNSLLTYNFLKHEFARQFFIQSLVTTHKQNDPSLNTDVVNLVITKLHGGGFVLGSSASHIAFDGYSIYHLFENLTYLYRGDPVNPPKVNRNFSLPKKSSTSSPKNKSHTYDYSKPKNSTLQNFLKKKLYSLYYKDKTISINRNLLNNVSIGNFSKHDFLMAYIMKSLANCLNNKDNFDFVLQFPQDFRKYKYFEGVDENYIGNGIVERQLSFNIGLLKTYTVENIAIRIRELINSISINDLRKNISLELRMKYARLSSHANNENIFLLFSNWSKLPINKIKFSSNKNPPIFDVPFARTHVRDRIITIFPESSEVNYWSVRAHLPRDEMNKFIGLVQNG